MSLSAEQQDTIDLLLQEDVHLVQTDSIAGSGKSTLAKAASDVIPGKHLYTSFMKSAVNEALTKYDSNKVDCKTTHGLCYRTIVMQGISMPGIKPGPRKVDFFGYRNITEVVSYDTKLSIVDTMEKYFTSTYVSLTKFLDTTDVSDIVRTAVIKYVKQMAEKTIPCTHGFYMKYYHILLDRGVIPSPKYAFVVLDEAQDSSGVALEIFKLLDSPKKLLIGDPHQNCMSFANSVNGFEVLKGEGVVTKLTTSYRVSDKIAPSIQKFGRKYLDPDFVFKGIPIEDETVKTKVYIARTNGSLIAKMIELNKRNIQYNLPREPEKMFKLLIDIVSLKPGSKIKGPNKFLVDDVRDYYQTNQEKSLLSFIASRHSKDKAIKTAVKTIVKYGGKLIWDTFNIAKAHNSAVTTFPLSLATIHSSKGNTYDEAELDPDVYPEWLLDTSGMSEDEIQNELNLLYIATTRCRVSLLNADWLTEI